MKKNAPIITTIHRIDVFSLLLILSVVVFLQNHVDSFTTVPSLAAERAHFHEHQRQRLYSSSALPSTPSTTTTATTMDTSREYTTEQLRDALLRLNGEDTVEECGHIYGHGDFNNNHVLSKLQTITATVYLDYEHYLNSSHGSTPPSLATLESSNSRNDKINKINCLYTTIRNCHPRMALAAEFKRASPSKGRILAVDSPTAAAEQAKLYTQGGGGADIVSVLTEPRWFQGSLDDLRQVRAAVPKSVVVLRKDFVVNEYMIAEAAALAKADTVLLIVAVLSKTTLQRLLHYARTVWQMEPLVEVHADAELEVALEVGAKVIGVNNRNLHTFQVDLGTSERVAERLRSAGYSLQPGDDNDSNDDSKSIALCALSGMSTAMDVDRYRQAGVSMCLIGESLMRAADPAQAIQGLCLDPAAYQAATATTGSGGAYTAGTQIIKVCGMTQPDDALVACRAGANMIGIIFVPASPRCIASRAAAKAVVDTVRAFGERQERMVWETTTTDAAASPLRHLASSATALHRAVRQTPAVVGVFQNQDPDYIRSMVKECGLDMVQLHGKEGMAAAAEDNFGVPVIRVVDIAVDDADDATTTTTDTVAAAAAAPDAVEKILQTVTSDPAAILLDTSIRGKAGGGTGVTFDWSIAERLQNAGLPVLVAGGLHADSVADCVGTIRPYGVDVSSGVETSPGVKDHDKVQRFVRGARTAAAEASKGF